MSEDTNLLPELLLRRLIQRRDVFAQQLPDGAYNPVRRPVEVSDLREHLEGRATYGHYVVDTEGFVRVVAFDFDWADTLELPPGVTQKKSSLSEPLGEVINPREVFSTDHPARPWMNAEIRSMADGVAWRLKRFHPEVTVATAFSGSKGIHVYGFLGKKVPAGTARETAIDVLDSFGCFQLIKGKNFYGHEGRRWSIVDKTSGDLLKGGFTTKAAAEAELGGFEDPKLVPEISIEVFPKQAKVGKGGFGNLLRLPLGINQKTGRRGFFYDPRTDIHTLEPCDPIEALMYGTVIPQ